MTLRQADDYRQECNDLASVLTGFDSSDWVRATQFKQWTFRDIVGHLFMFDSAARLTIEDPPAFKRLIGDVMGALKRGASMAEFTREWLGETSHQDLLSRWRAASAYLADLYAGLKPAQRVAWAGPDMSARSCISARQMEVWAHGQAIYDALGLIREEKDRIENVVVIGVNTFGWTFTVRGLPVPDTKPHVRLTFPSGAVGTWNASDEANFIAGSAVDYCRVVTHTRNIADTDLVVAGETAREWMSFAQCFAGAPETPPAPGSRFVVQRG